MQEKYFIKIFFLCLFLCLPVYPGFMSYDSFHAYISALEGVSDSIWPPMVSYIWKIILFFSKNVFYMHIIQVLLLAFSVFGLLHAAMKSKRISFLCLIFITLIPSILGSILVIWKDVLMAALFLLSFYLIEQSKKRKIFIILGLITIFLASCVRHNAIIVSIFPLIYLFYSHLMNKENTTYKLVKIYFLSILLFFLFYLGKVYLDNYSLPSMELINENKKITTNAFTDLKIIDLAGASICSGKDYFNGISPVSINNLPNHVSYAHVNLNMYGELKPTKIWHMVKTYYDSGSNIKSIDHTIDYLWLEALKIDPLCLLDFKIKRTLLLLGYNPEISFYKNLFTDQFLVTHPLIEKNNYGITLNSNNFLSFLRGIQIDYINFGSKLFFLKPWFIFLMSFLLFSYFYMRNILRIFKNKKHHRYPFFRLDHVILISGWAYLLGLLLFGNAADARLAFYFNITNMIYLCTHGNSLLLHKTKKVNHFIP